MFKYFRALLVLLAMISSSATYADLAIIAHPDYEGGELTEEAVRKLFLSERVSFPSGHKAKIVNHAAGSPDRKDFFEYVLKMGESSYKRYWSRKKAAGKKGSPEELSNYEDVLTWVSKNPLGIAYVDKRMTNDSVKVLLTIDVFEDL